MFFYDEHINYILNLEPKYKSIKKVEKLKKAGKPLPTYDDYIKWYKREGSIGFCINKDIWNKLSEPRKYEVFREKKNDCVSLFCMYILGGGGFIGIVVGSIAFGIYIDDILISIPIILGLPLFIIGGFFGAGKGL